MIWAAGVNRRSILGRLRRNAVEPYQGNGLTQRRLSFVAKSCSPLFRQYVRGGELILVFAFDRANMDAEHRLKNIWGVHMKPANGKNCIIGLAVDVIDHGRDLATSVFIHEISHFAHNNHGADFVDHYHKLLATFNHHTERNIMDCSLMRL